MIANYNNNNQMTLSEEQTKIIGDVYTFADTREKVSCEYSEEILFKVLKSRKFLRLFIDTIQQQQESRTNV